MVGHRAGIPAPVAHQVAAIQPDHDCAGVFVRGRGVAAGGVVGKTSDGWGVKKWPVFGRSVGE